MQMVSQCTCNGGACQQSPPFQGVPNQRHIDGAVCITRSQVSGSDQDQFALDQDPFLEIACIQVLCTHDTLPSFW